MFTMCVKDPSDAIPIINAMIRCAERNARTGRVRSLDPEICEAIVKRPYGRVVQYGRGLRSRTRTLVSLSWFKWRGLLYLGCDILRKEFFPRCYCVHVDSSDKWFVMWEVNREVYTYRRLVLSMYFKRRLERMGIPGGSSYGRINGITVPRMIGSRRFAVVRYCSHDTGFHGEASLNGSRVDLVFDCGLRLHIENTLPRRSVSRMLHFYWIPQAPEWIDVATGLGLKGFVCEPVDADKLHDKVKTYGGTWNPCRCDGGHGS